MLNVLLHFLPASSGSITIDGIDISTISPQVLRQRLTAIPQEDSSNCLVLRELCYERALS